MLDTLGLRMYGANDVKSGTLAVIQANNGLSPFAVPEHNELYRKMLKKKGKNFHVKMFYNRETESFENIPEEEWILYQNQKTLDNHYQIRDKIRFIDEGKAKEINQAINGNYRVPSSFSDVTFNINENGGFIDFTVSIPKYLYGHSLAQFIPQNDSELKFKHGMKFHDWNFQAKHLHARLRKFIDKFLTDLCNYFGVEVFPNENYIEIRRLDLCYNMPFQSKEESLKVLRELQKIDKRNRKKKLNSNIQAGYETTHAFKSAVGAYFKIYHKGTEYSESKHGDLKKHLEINREFIESRINRYSNPENRKFYGDHQDEIWGFFKSKGKGQDFQLSEKNEAKLKAVIDQINRDVPYKVNFLKKEMDKILRYEISLRGAYFSNLYKRKVFRRNDPVHQKAVKMYKKTASVLNNTAKNPTKITREERRNYKMMHQFLNRGVSLIVGDNHTLIRHGNKSGKDYNAINDEYRISRFEYAHTVLGKHDAVHFSDFFLRQCVKDLKKFIKEFSIDKIEPYDDIASKIHEYNAQVERKVELYNERNRFKIMKPNGEFRRKKVKVLKPVREHELNEETGKWQVVTNLKPTSVEEGAIITKATQLLTDTEKRKQGLKRVNATLLCSFLTQMYSHGKSLDQIFTEMNTNKSTKSRIRADLRTFGVFDNSLSLPEGVIMKTDFDDYYWKTSSLAYQNKFYRNPKLIAEDYGINPFDPQEQANIA